MVLKSLFQGLAETLDGPEPIEQHGRAALLNASPPDAILEPCLILPDTVLSVLSLSGAHPVCEMIAETRLPWAPPKTSTDKKYVADSLPKVHVELIGPEGLVKSDHIRLGLYGILPNADYGIRTHPAEETFVMLAGEAHWKRGNGPYQAHGPGERSYHPSMLPHATRTTDTSFMSIYVWHGDISTENYVYLG